MAQYYFHIRENGRLLADPDGLELRDLGSAVDACRDIVKGVLGDQKWGSALSADREFVIQDELGQTLLVVPFIGLVEA